MERSLDLKLLAQLLAEPQADALEHVREVAEVLPWLGEAMEELEQTSVPEWMGEHTRLFVNGFPRTKAPPFRSAWLEGGLNGRGTLELESIYHQAGLEAVEGLPADYLGTMLEFMAHLQEHPPVGGGMDAEGFRREFFQPWIQLFTTALKEGSALKLYRLMAIQLEGHLA